MRRIYDSNALHRDDEEPMVPNQEDSTRPQAFRTLNATSWSRRIVPNRLRHWAISVEVSTPRSEYPLGSRVPFTVTMKNALPFPITISVLSPVCWQWTVDGLPEASEVELHDAPDRSVAFDFDRGERKEFKKRWDGMFRTSEAEWESAEAGEHTIGAELNVENSATKGLYDETTIRFREDPE